MTNTTIIPETDNRYFSFFCDQWLDENIHNWKASSRSKYTSILEKHIKPVLGDFPIQEISTRQVCSFSSDLMKKLSVKSVRDILTVLHQILNYTSRKTTLEPVTITYPKLYPEDLRILDHKEQLRLTGYLTRDFDVYRFAVLLSLSTGLRLGEVCALQRCDISLETRTITVRHTVQRITDFSPSASAKTILRLGTPKTLNSLRTIPLSDNLLVLYRQLPKAAPNTFLLTGTTKPADPRTLQRRFKKYADACKIKNVHFHTLRHTFATRCVEVGCDIKTLSEILGHSSITMTMSRYVHPSLEFKRQNLMKLDAAGFGCNLNIR